MAAVLANISDFLQRLHPSSDLEKQSDAALLRRFVGQGDQVAFAALVGRHGPLVLGICQRQLRHRQDVEDAFQATFLVLARRAGDIQRPERLGNWLFGVARKTAGRIRQRQVREVLTSLRGDVAAKAPNEQDERIGALDQELARLPDRDRLVVVLCCLEGRSREEAAREMGETPGAVKGLLERARQRLRERLGRQRVGAESLGTMLGAAVVSPGLLRATIGLGTFIPGSAAGTVEIVAQEVMHTMFSLRWKVLSAVVLLVGICSGIGLALQPDSTGARRMSAAVKRPDPKPEPNKPEGEVDIKTKSKVSHLVFTPGKDIVTATADGSVTVWHGMTGKEKKRWVEHLAPVSALAISPDGKLLSSADQNGKMITRQFDTGQKVWVYSKEVPGFSSVIYAPDNKAIFAVSDEGLLELDSPTGRALGVRKVGELKESAQNVVLSPDGKQVLVGGRVTLNEGSNWTTFHLMDIKGKLLSTSSGKRLSLNDLPRTADYPVPVTFSPDSKLWAGAASDHTIHLGNDKTLVGHKQAITGLVFLPGGNKLVSASRDGSIRVWDVAKQKSVAEVTRQGEVATLVLSADGKRLAWASGGVVKIRSVAAVVKDNATKE